MTPRLRRWWRSLWPRRGWRVCVTGPEPDVVGEVLRWGTTVEHFDGVPFSVPAILINTGRSVVVVPLKTERGWSEVDILDPLVCSP